MPGSQILRLFITSLMCQSSITCNLRVIIFVNPAFGLQYSINYVCMYVFTPSQHGGSEQITAHWQIRPSSVIGRNTEEVGMLIMNITNNGDKTS